MNANSDELIQAALRCLEDRLYYDKTPITGTNHARDLARLSLAKEPNEVFAVFFLDAKNRVIAFEKLFFGSITHSSIHPRIVVQKALAHNAASVIFAHNHPSGSVEPSQDDKTITETLAHILKIVDVTVLDHFIVSTEGALSFAERGLL